MRSELGCSLEEVGQAVCSPESQEVGQSEPPGPLQGMESARPSARRPWLQYAAPWEAKGQSRPGELAVVGARDQEWVPPAEVVVLWPATPGGSAEGAGPSAGGIRLQASHPVHPRCVQSPDHEGA